jgi:hypothetical protein
VFDIDIKNNVIGGTLGQGANSALLDVMALDKILVALPYMTYYSKLFDASVYILPLFIGRDSRRHGYGPDYIFSQTS